MPRSRKGKTPSEQLPPCDLEAEGAVLGALMLDPDAFERVKFLRADHFYAEAHRRIFEAMVALRAEGQPFDNVQVGSRLREWDRLQQVGGAAYLTTLLMAVPTVKNVAAYAGTVENDWRRRETIRIGQRIAAEGYAGTEDVSALVRDAVASLEAVSDADRRRLGDDTGWEEQWTKLDNDTFSTTPPPRDWLLKLRRDGAFPCGRVGVLAAEGGAGKTMLLVQLGLAVATGSKWLQTFDVPVPGRVLLVLGEEDREEVRRRMYHAGQAMGLNASALRNAIARITVLPLAGKACSMLTATGDDGPFLKWLRRKLADQPSGERWRFIGVDPLSRFAGLDAEKDNAAATRFIQAIESIASETGAGVIVAHHTNKAARVSGEGSTGAARGSSALTDGARWVGMLTVDRLKFDTPAESERLGRIATLTVTKQNYSRHVPEHVYRYDSDHGGALVPVERADLSRIDRGRARADAETRAEQRSKAPGKSRRGSAGATPGLHEDSSTDYEDAS